MSLRASWLAFPSLPRKDCQHQDMHVMLPCRFAQPKEFHSIPSQAPTSSFSVSSCRTEYYLCTLSYNPFSTRSVLQHCPSWDVRCCHYFFLIRVSHHQVINVSLALQSTSFSSVIPLVPHLSVALRFCKSNRISLTMTLLSSAGTRSPPFLPVLL